MYDVTWLVYVLVGMLLLGLVALVADLTIDAIQKVYYGLLMHKLYKQAVKQLKKEDEK